MASSMASSSGMRRQSSVHAHSMDESTTPPNSASVDQSGFGTGSAAAQHDDLLAWHESSPTRRLHEYRNLCDSIVEHMSHEHDKEGFIAFPVVLTMLFKHVKSTYDRSMVPVMIKLLLETTSSSFVPVLQRSLTRHARQLPVRIVEKVFELQPHISDDGQAQPSSPYRLKPVQPADVVLDHVDRYLSCSGTQAPLSTSTPSQYLELLIPLMFTPHTPTLALELEPRIHHVERAFSTRFLGPAVDRLIFHLAVHSRHAFSTNASNASTNSISRSRNEHSPPQPSTDLQPALPYYARVMPILQSSGFGKTKMCVHLSAKHPGLLVCLRHQPHQEAVSFPPQDPLVYDYMQACLRAKQNNDARTKGKKDDDLAVHFRLANFLAAYCAILRQYLEELMRLSGCLHSFADPLQANQNPSSSRSLCWRTLVFVLATSLKRGFLEDLALDPPETFCPHVDTFRRLGLLQRTQVEQGDASLGLDVEMSPLELSPDQTIFVAQLTAHDARSRMISTMIDQANEANGTSREPQAATSPEKMARDIIRPQLLELEQLVECGGLDPETIFYLALDECGTIELLLPHIRRLWNYAEPKRTWILLVDTNSRISAVAGKTASTASGRTDLFTGTHQLPVPFTAMPLDVHPTRQHAIELSEDIKAGTCSLRRLNQMLPQLGRPLWNDSSLFRDSSFMLRCHAIIGKLISSISLRWPDQLPSPHQQTLDLNFQAIMALVLQRVPMGRSCFSEQTIWQEFVKRQISNHLRFIEKVLPHSNVVKSHVVSEPPLSVAAAWSFRHEPSRIGFKWSTAIMTLASARNAVGLEVGLEGEEGVQLVCSMAADFAAGEAYRDEYVNVGFDDVDPGRYDCTMGLVRLDRWLELLIGDKYDPRMPAADPKQAPVYCEQVKVDFLAWCRNQWLNFKHVADLAEVVSMSKTLDRSLLAQCWLRHAAVRGISTQAGWDLLIPVYSSPSVPIHDEPFQISRLSCVAIQVKNELYSPAFPDPLGPYLSAADTVGVDRGGHEHEREHKAASQEGEASASSSAATTTTLELYLDLRGPSRLPSLLKLPPTRVEENDREQGPEQPQHEQTRYNIYVSGLDVERYPVLGRLEGDARGLMPTMFGLSHLGTSRFETDFINAVHGLDAQGHEQARKQLHDLRGFMPIFDGIPTSQGQAEGQPSLKLSRRGYAKGQAKRMRRIGDTQ